MGKRLHSHGDDGRAELRIKTWITRENHQKDFGACRVCRSKRLLDLPEKKTNRKKWTAMHNAQKQLTRPSRE